MSLTNTMSKQHATIYYTRVKCIVRYRTKNAVAAEYSHSLQSSLAEANKAGPLPMVALLGRGNMIHFYIP